MKTQWLYFVLCSKCYVILVANDWKKWADMWWFLVTIWNLDCKHLNSHWMTEKWSECTNFLLLSGFLQPQSGSSSCMAFENLLLNHISWSLFMKQNQLFHYALGTKLPNENSQQYEHVSKHGIEMPSKLFLYITIIEIFTADNLGRRLITASLLLGGRKMAFSICSLFTPPLIYSVLRQVGFQYELGSFRSCFMGKLALVRSKWQQ